MDNDTIKLFKIFRDELCRSISYEAIKSINDILNNTNQDQISEDERLRKRINDLEKFLIWCLENGGTTKDFVMALYPDKPLEEILRIAQEYDQMD